MLQEALSSSRWQIRAGAWIFASRSWTPVPLVVVMLVFARPALPTIAAGVVLMLAGEVLRLWAVRHIGFESRSRTDGPKHLATTGPYTHYSHPLYLANFAIATGALVAAYTPLWLSGTVLAMTLFQYALITKYEEWQLHRKFGEVYAQYRCGRAASLAKRPLWSWRGAILSERRTLQGITLLLLALLLRW